jgi:hypothetical protein
MIADFCVDSRSSKTVSSQRPVILNPVSEWRAGFSARVGVKDLVFSFPVKTKVPSDLLAR